MRLIALLLTCVTALLPFAALAHITDVPHAHPHLVEFTVGQGAVVAGLFALSLLLLWSARQFAGRRRK